MSKNKRWQSMVLALALFVLAVPLAVIAQSTPVSAPQVCGELAEQFSKHYLELRPMDAGNDMALVMSYNPNDNQAVRSESGFVVFNAGQFEAAVRQGGNLLHPAIAKIAVGSEGSESGRNVKQATLPGESLNLVVINDSITPLDYCLSGTNVTFVDQSGEQVRDPNQSLPPATGETPAQTAPEGETAAPTLTATPAATATPDTATSVVVTETATVTVAATDVQPTVVQTTTLAGVLDDPFQVHIYPLDVANIRQSVELRLNDINNAGVDLVVFTEDQFQTWINSGVSPTSSRLSNSIVAGPDAGLGDPANVKRTNIQQPARRFLAVVYNSRTPGSPYELSLVNENGLLIDESAQSTTAQEMQVGAPGTPTAEIPEDSGTVTATPGTPATAAVATGDGTIEIGSTYRVVAGDTMSTIARRAYGDVQLYDELCAYNNIANCNLIEVGDPIEIPARSELDSITTTTPAPADTTATPVPTAAAPITTTTVTTATVTTTAPITPAPTVAGTAAGDIVQMAGSFNSLDTLGLLLDLLAVGSNQANNIEATLSGAGPYTVFAPVDSAFTALSEEMLGRLIENPAELANVLRRHIVPGTLTAADLTDGMRLETLSGASLTVGVGTDGTVTVDGVPVVQADVAATNGIIHVVNAVLLPPSP